jgi:clathrin heavy chain
VALELGWVNGYHNFIMPYFIQTFRRTHVRLNELETRTAPPKEEETAQGTIAQTYGNLAGFGSGTLMIENGGMGMAAGIPGGIPGPGMVPMPGMGGPDMSGFGVPQNGQPGMVPNGGLPNGMPPQMAPTM